MTSMQNRMSNKYTCISNPRIKLFKDNNRKLLKQFMYNNILIIDHHVTISFFFWLISAETILE